MVASYFRGSLFPEIRALIEDYLLTTESYRLVSHSVKLWLLEHVSHYGQY